MDARIGETQVLLQQKALQPDISLQITIPNEFKKMCPINIAYTAGIETDRVSPVWLEKGNEIVGDEWYILRSINKHEHIGNSLNPASISTILKTLQEGLKTGSNQQPLSGHSFRVGAALDLLEQGEPLEKIMLRGGWQTDSTAMKYLRNWHAF